MRLDVKMVELALAPSREKARALIMAGAVTVDGKRADKPGSEIKDGMEIAIKEDPIPFVSRGGLKLQKAVQCFDLNLQDVCAVDVGASTGGFTDCMLQHGAKQVYALDVGYGQLDWRLRNDERVVVYERKNARNMQPDWYDQALDFASIDVSFISLQLILPPLHACLKPGALVVALIKPQFEAGRSQVGKNGVVRDENVHKAVCEKTIQFAYQSGFDIRGLDYSPITGPEGNMEFLIVMQKNCSSCVDELHICNIIDEAHDNFIK